MRAKIEILNEVLDWASRFVTKSLSLSLPIYLSRSINSKKCNTPRRCLHRFLKCCMISRTRKFSDPSRCCFLRRTQSQFNVIHILSHTRSLTLKREITTSRGPVIETLQRAFKCISRHLWSFIWLFDMSFDVGWVVSLFSVAKYLLAFVPRIGREAWFSLRSIQKCNFLGTRRDREQVPWCFQKFFWMFDIKVKCFFGSP